MKTVLVTGGAGYIGSHACKALAEHGYTPVCFDNLSTGWRDAVKFGPLCVGNLLNPDDISHALDHYRPDAVMHFAALSLVGMSVQKPSTYWRSNVVGVLNLLDGMRVRGIANLVFSSTAAVYGEPAVELIQEAERTEPTNPYGATKLAIEKVINDFSNAYGLRAVVFRYFNVAGASPDGLIGEWHRPETHLIPIILDVAVGKRPHIIIHGSDYPTADGTCVRDYLHVCDLVEAHILALERLAEGEVGLTLNLGIGRGYSVREVINRARAVTGCPIPEVLGVRRSGDPSRLVCDGTRASRALGWQPTRSEIDQMITDAWHWHRRGGYADNR